MPKKPVVDEGQRDPEPFVRQLAQQWHSTELSIDAGTQIVRATRRASR